MARPSSRSVSFAQAAQEKSKERGSSRDGYEEGVTERNTTIESGGSLDPQGHDITEQYRLQNKTLSQHNDILQRRLKDMEQKISDLITDNIELKNKNDLVAFKRQMNENLEVLERKLNVKIEEINQILKEFKLTIQNKSEYNILRERNLLELGQLKSSSSTRRQTYHLNKKPISIFQDDSTKESMGTITVADNSRYTVDLDKENIPPPGIEVGKMGTNVPSMVTEASGESQYDDEGSKSDTPSPLIQKPISTTSNPVTSSLNPESININPMTSISNSMTTTPKSSKRRRRTTFAPSKIGTNEQLPKRSSRTRTPVDYKEPSLGKKLRRESVHMVDAVTDDYFKHMKKQKLHREPLQHVDGNIHQQTTTQNKSTTKNKSNIEDNSIFDFMDQVKPNNRRYTIHQ